MALATLTIDLVAKMANIERDMGKAAQIAQKNADKMEKAFAGASRAFAAIGVGVSVGAFASMIKGVAESADAVRRLSQLSGAGTEEFQRYAAGAKSVGFESEKMADIFKDVNDKVGDFLTTGGGPLKDFFENVAPKIGITADAFRNLSGPQALQLYASSLEKANLSQAKTTFYMEAIANDATALIPLLANGGAKMREFGDAAAAAGAIMDEKLVASSAEFNRNMQALDKSLEGFRVRVGVSVIPAMNDLVEFTNRAIERYGVLGGLITSVGAAALQAGGVELNALKREEAEVQELFARRAKLVEDVAAAQERAAAAPYGMNRQILKGQANDLKQSLDAVTRDLDSAIARRDELQARAASGVLRPNVLPDTDPVGAPPSASRAKASAAKSPALRSFEDYDAKIMQAVAGAITDNDVTRAADLAAQVQKLDDLYFNAGLSAEIYDAAMQKLTGVSEEFNDSQERLNALLGNTASAQLEKQRDDMLLLADAFERGKISVEQLSEAFSARLGTDVPKAAKDASDAMSEFSKNFAASAQGTIADLLFTGAEEGFDGLVDNFGKALQRMAAEAAAAKIMENLFGASFGQSGNIDAASIIGKIGTLMSFDGGGYTGNGPRSGGIDGKGGRLSILHPRETIIDHTKGQRAAGTTIVQNITVNGGSAPDVRRSAGQGAREALSVIGGAQRYS